MFYTCIIRSIYQFDQRYIGSTSDLRKCLMKHNEGGGHIQQNSVRGKQKPISPLKQKKKPLHLKRISKTAPVMPSPTVTSDSRICA